MNKMRVSSRLGRLEIAVSVLLSAASILFISNNVEAQTSWVGPIALAAKGIAPDGTGIGYWYLAGGEQSNGGYGTNYVDLVPITSGGGPATIQVQTYITGMLPATVTGGYAVASDANGGPWVPWASYESLIGAYYNKVSTEPIWKGGYTTSYGAFAPQYGLPSALSVGVGDPAHYTYDIWAVGPGNTTVPISMYIGSGLTPTINQVPGATKVAVFNETLSCENGRQTIHQPFILTSSHTIYRYEFNQSVGACTPEPNNGCEYGCWQQVNGLATDIAPNYILGYPASVGVYEWNATSSSWSNIITGTTGATLVGIGAAPGFSSLSTNANIAGYDASGNVYRYCAALYGQCGGEGYTGPTCCAFTQATTSPASYSSGSKCQITNQYYSQCVPD